MFNNYYVLLFYQYIVTCLTKTRIIILTDYNLIHRSFPQTKQIIDTSLWEIPGVTLRKNCVLYRL